MSRSFKKQPFFGWCSGKSQKQEKRQANKKLRHENKRVLHNYLKGAYNYWGNQYIGVYFDQNNEIYIYEDDFDVEVKRVTPVEEFKILREVSNVYWWRYDGKRRISLDHLSKDKVKKLMAK